MTVDVKRLLSHGRTKLVLENPFITAILLRLKMSEMPASFKGHGMETFATDGYNIWYNPDWIIEQKLEPKHIATVLAHEILHVVLLHHTRRGNRDPKKWNCAADFVINLILKQNNFDLPGEGRTLDQCLAAKPDDNTFGYLLDPKFQGMNTEQVYELLPDPPRVECYVMGVGAVIEPGSAPGENGEDGKKPTAGELAEAEAEGQVLIAQAELAAKQAGKYPAGMERFVQNSLEVKIDWRERLQKFFRKTKIAESTWKRPNRRYLHGGLILPTDIKEPTGTVVVCVDTSGSIGGPELNAFASEMQAIYQFVNPERMIVMYCDADIGSIEEFYPKNGDQLEIKPVGGGGTDFRPPFNWLKAEDIVPEAFVYLTDGYGPFPEEQEFPVLWVINNHSVTPPNGEHVVLEV